MLAQDVALRIAEPPHHLRVADDVREEHGADAGRSGGRGGGVRWRSVAFREEREHRVEQRIDVTRPGDVVVALKRHEPSVGKEHRELARLLERDDLIITPVQHDCGHR